MIKIIRFDYKDKDYFLFFIIILNPRILIITRPFLLRNITLNYKIR